MNTPYVERMALARARLAHVLAPSTDQETALVDWLGKWDLPTLETLAGLAERAVSTARAEGYEHGWAEGVERAMQLDHTLLEQARKLADADVDGKFVREHLHQYASEARDVLARTVGGAA